MHKKVDAQRDNLVTVVGWTKLTTKGELATGECRRKKILSAELSPVTRFQREYLHFEDIRPTSK